MAIGKAKVSVEGGDFKKYIGIASFRVCGVNPTAAQLSDFYGRDVQTEPEYVKECVDENDGNKPYKRVRISFMIQADKMDEKGKEIKINAGLEEPLKTTVNFFLETRYRYNKDKTKIQVIDKYGRTAWPTIEQAKNHQIPVYSNGPANLDKDYRPCLRGEESLTEFIINYLNISPVQVYNQGTATWSMVSHPEDCECSLEHIKDYFKGDFKELREVCNYLPMNRVKIPVGIRRADDGKLYMQAYGGATLRNSSSNHTRIIDSIAGTQQAGGLSDVMFAESGKKISEIHEYVDNTVHETDLKDKVQQTTSDNELPFGESSNDVFAF